LPTLAYAHVAYAHVAYAHVADAHVAYAHVAYAHVAILFLLPAGIGLIASLSPLHNNT
jgi:hypothetical protein